MYVFLRFVPSLYFLYENLEKTVSMIWESILFALCSSNTMTEKNGYSALSLLYVQTAICQEWPAEGLERIKKIVIIQDRSVKVNRMSPLASRESWIQTTW